MKKQLSMLFCAAALVFGLFSFSTNASASSNEEGETASVSDTNTLVKEENEITPYWYDYRDKTITDEYTSISQVPEIYPYREYVNGYWYSGNLKLKSVVLSGNKYIATFSGTLSTWMN